MHIAQANTKMVWIDLEMSGLDPATCTILEIATVVTDSNLGIIATGPDIVVHHTDSVLSSMSDWCKAHHGQSGLTAQVIASTVSLTEAEEQTLTFLQTYLSPKQAPLCGNSVDLDRRFLERHMPRIFAFLGDDLIDVSTVKELCRRWSPDKRPPAKKDHHRALDDILESVDELRFYKHHFFRQKPLAGQAS